MSDLFNIPNDDGVDYRVRKFIEYQHEVPPIHPTFTREYISRNIVNLDDATRFCWYVSCLYSEIGAAVIHYLVENGVDPCELESFIGEIPVNSARKHVKYCGRLPCLVCGFEDLTSGKPHEFLRRYAYGEPEENYRRLSLILQSIPGCGRFSADLFLEVSGAISDVLGIGLREPSEINWKEGYNLTSGLFNLYYEDEAAERYDKTKKLTAPEVVWLCSKVRELQALISETYPGQNTEISTWIGKICSFRNLFKGTRYGGYHHDRQLGVILGLDSKYCWLSSEAFLIREKLYDRRFLGEFGGWDGIRGERKRLWLEKGLTGVEI